MPSPFPGMDPYLQAHWVSFHNKLVHELGFRLNELLPPDLRADVEERIVIATPEGFRYPRPDGTVSLRRVPPSSPAATRPSGGLAVVEPVRVRLDDEPVHETYLVITDLVGERVVTTLEVLSPSNKLPGPDRAKHLRNRDEDLAGGANIVEIDLCRVGDRTLPNIESFLTPTPHSRSLVLVRRAATGEWEIYSSPLPEPLPTFRLPLRGSDADVEIALQQIVDRILANSRYPIDYAKPPSPRSPARTPSGRPGSSRVPLDRSSSREGQGRPTRRTRPTARRTRTTPASCSRGRGRTS